MLFYRLKLISFNKISFILVTEIPNRGRLLKSFKFAKIHFNKTRVLVGATNKTVGQSKWERYERWQGILKGEVSLYC